MWPAWAALLLTVVGAAWSIGDPAAGLFDVVEGASLLLGVSAVATIGALLVSRRRAPLPGALLLSFSVCWSIGRSSYHLLELSLREGEPAHATATVLIAVGDAGYVLAIYSLLLLLLVVPDGHLPSPRWKPVAVMLLVSAVFWCVQSAWLATTVDDLDAWVSRTNPISLDGANPGALLVAVSDVGAVLSTASLGLVAGALVVRHRSAQIDHRQQLAWVFVGGLAVLGWLMLWIPQPDGEFGRVAQSLVPGLAFMTLAGAFGLALFRHRLWNVDLVIRRSLVYGVLWMAIAAVYVVVAAGFGLAASARLPVQVAIAMTVAFTLIFQPARLRLEGLADRWVFGRRRSPAEVLHTFGEAVERTDRADQVAAELADLAVRSLGLAWVMVEIDGSLPVVRGEGDDAPTTEVPIEWGKERWGLLRCRSRYGETLDDDGLALLGALATQAALATSHARLAKRIVHAQAEERRRIERNIHDGAQQELAILIGQVGLLHTRVHGDAELADLVGRIQDGVRRTLADIRVLAQGIHPSVLRDGGLVAAVEDRCTQMPLNVALRVPPELRTRRVPEDIEAAAYFTVVEALTNVLKHASTRNVDVEIAEEADAGLRVAISDDGCGFDPLRPTTGSGLSGLADRIRALGGDFAVATEPGSGTEVVVRLPCRAGKVVAS